MTKRSMPAISVHPIHFEDFDGKAFERLVYAYHARSDRWISLEWYGQSGKDQGRDIVGIRQIDTDPVGEKMFILCANWRRLTTSKIATDIDHAIASPSGKPSRIRIICGHSVSAPLRDKAKKHAESKGIYSCELWSGPEFEEHVRSTAESLLLRFCQGEVFPDAPRDLLMFAWGANPISDAERLDLITRAFIRPAFESPIDQESSLPAFRVAIEDTIRVLNTGVWLTREGNMIQRLPTVIDVCDVNARTHLVAAKNGLMQLRTEFDDLLRSGAIAHCGCQKADCPVFQMSHDAITTLTATRNEILAEIRAARENVGLMGAWVT